jgi:hypothetical protein
MLNTFNTLSSFNLKQPPKDSGMTVSDVSFNPFKTMSFSNQNAYIGMNRCCSSTGGRYIYSYSWVNNSSNARGVVQWIDTSNNTNGSSPFYTAGGDYATLEQVHIYCDPTGQVVVVGDITIGAQAFYWFSKDYGQNFVYIFTSGGRIYNKSNTNMGYSKNSGYNYAIYLFGTNTAYLIANGFIDISGGTASPAYFYKLTTLQAFITDIINNSNTIPTTTRTLLPSQTTNDVRATTIAASNDEKYIYYLASGDGGVSGFFKSSDFGANFANYTRNITTSKYLNAPGMACDSTGRYVALNQTSGNPQNSGFTKTNIYSTLSTSMFTFVDANGTYQNNGLWLSNDYAETFSLVNLPALSGMVIFNIVFATNSITEKTYLGGICVKPTSTTTGTTTYNYFILIGSVKTNLKNWNFYVGNINYFGKNITNVSSVDSNYLPSSISISPDGTIATVVCMNTTATPITQVYQFSLSGY